MHRLANSSLGGGTNMARLLWQTAEAHGDRPAIVCGDLSTDYSSLAARASALGNALTAAGVEPGDRVAIFLQRGADAAAAFFGTVAVGAIAIMVNESLRSRQIEYILSHTGARILLTSEAMLAQQPRPLEGDATPLMIDDVPRSGELRLESRNPQDVAQIVYTSGSSGEPKGVIMSHGALHSSIGSITDYLGIQADDRIGTVMPFGFTYGFNQLMCAVGRGAALVIEQSTLPDAIVTNLRTRGISLLAGVASLWHQLLGVPQFREKPVESLRAMTNAGGPIPSSTVRALRKANPRADLFLMYGMTEVIRSTYLDPAEVDQRPDSIGKAMSGTEIMVLREDLTPCQPGEVGELVHRGPTVASGYWHDPESTAAIFRPNPLLPPGEAGAERVVFSGDLVRRDEEGFLYFVGRRDRMIKSLGYRVSPDEITDVMHASGEVTDAAVTAEPDERRGQAVVAHVVLKTTGSLERLKRFCRMELPRYMHPTRFELRDTLPKLPSGKPDIETLTNL